MYFIIYALAEPYSWCISVSILIG